MGLGFSPKENLCFRDTYQNIYQWSHMMSYLNFKVIHTQDRKKVNRHINEIELVFSWHLVKSGNSAWESIVILFLPLDMFGISYDKKWFTKRRKLWPMSSDSKAPTRGLRVQLVCILRTLPRAQFLSTSCKMCGIWCSSITADTHKMLCTLIVWRSLDD